MVYKRDFTGYHNDYPDFKWPGNKNLAVSLVFNYEEGSEHSYNRDKVVESIGEFLPVDVNRRDIGNETVYEYGQRSGIWRILNAINSRNIKATFFATAKALETNMYATKNIIENGHEICDHGYYWTELYNMDYSAEYNEIKNSIDLIEKLTGKKPGGFYAREPTENTVDILSEFGNFIYDSDSYADDLPFFYNRLLILPYTPDANDFHFLSPMNRFSTSNEFLEYLIDTFNTLHDEAQKQPKMMTAAFHVRVTGRPGRFPALIKFIDYITKYDDIWITTREEIAKFWIKNFKD